MTIDEKPVLMPEEEALSDARTIFLETLALTVPQVLEGLRQEALPAFQAIPTSVLTQTDQGPETSDGFEWPPTPVRLPDILLWRNLDRYADVKEVVAMKDALWRWAQEYDLQADWLLDRALLTLFAWSNPNLVHRDEEGKLVFASMFEVGRWTKLPPIDYKHSAWADEVWDDYVKSEVEAFKAHLEEHRNALLASGYMLEPDIGNYDHFTWLALAYGKRLNFKQIADLSEDERTSHLLPGGKHRKRLENQRKKRRESDEDLEEDIIRKAVHDKADLIGLPKLRTVKGRPRKPALSAKTGTRLTRI